MAKPRQKVIDSLNNQIMEGIFRPGQRLPTLAELMVEFDVSRGTVNSALDELIERGMIERRHGFGCFIKENPELENRTKKRIAFIAPGARQQSSYTHILEGLEQQAYKSNCEITFFNHCNNPEKAEEIVSSVASSNYAGIGVIPVIGDGRDKINHRLLDILEEYNSNFVTVDCPIFSGTVLRGSFIGSDNYNPVRKMARKLIADGRKTFASIRVCQASGSSAQRVTGLLDELKASGLEVREELHQVIEDVPIRLQGRSNIRRMIGAAKLPDVVFCTHDIIAANVISELGDAGFNVPEDIAVCGFDDSEIAEIMQLTSVHQDFFAMGVELWKMLSENFPLGGRTIRQKFLPCDVVFRRSTGCAGKAVEEKIS